MNNKQLLDGTVTQNFRERSRSLGRKFLSTSLSLLTVSSTAALTAMAHTQFVPTSPTVTHTTQTSHATAASQLASTPVHVVKAFAAQTTNPTSKTVSSGSAIPALHAVTTSSGNLNLGSPVALFAASSLAGFHTITLDIGGKKETVNFSSQLTGSELVAAQQVLSGGKQQITIAANGTATGGTVNLTAASLKEIDSGLGNSLSTLDISKHVVVEDSLSSLKLSGDLVNQGAIYVGPQQPMQKVSRTTL